MSTARTATGPGCNACRLRDMDEKTVNALRLLLEVFKKDIDPRKRAELLARLEAARRKLDN